MPRIVQYTAMIVDVGGGDWMHQYKNSALGKTGTFIDRGRYTSSMDESFRRGDFEFDEPINMPAKCNLPNNHFKTFDFIQVVLKKLSDDEEVIVNEWEDEDQEEEEYEEEYDDEEEEEQEEEEENDDEEVF